MSYRKGLWLACTVHRNVLQHQALRDGAGRRAVDGDQPLGQRVVVARVNRAKSFANQTIDSIYGAFRIDSKSS